MIQSGFVENRSHRTEQWPMLEAFNGFNHPTLHSILSYCLVNYASLFPLTLYSEYFFFTRICPTFAVFLRF